MAEGQISGAFWHSIRENDNKKSEYKNALILIENVSIVALLTWFVPFGVIGLLEPILAYPG